MSEVCQRCGRLRAAGIHHDRDAFPRPTTMKVFRSLNSWYAELPVKNHAASISGKRQSIAERQPSWYQREEIIADVPLHPHCVPKEGKRILLKTRGVRLF